MYFGRKRNQEEKYEIKATRGSLQGRKRSIQIPSFYGKIDSDAYLEWEKEMELVLCCHDYTKEKKVPLVFVDMHSLGGIKLLRPGDSMENHKFLLGLN